MLHASIFVVDMGGAPAVRPDIGAEYTNSVFIDYCNGLGIRRELTAPSMPQQNGPVESGFSTTIKAGHAPRREANKYALPRYPPQETEGSARFG